MSRWHSPSIENYQLWGRPMTVQSLLGCYLWMLSWHSLWNTVLASSRHLVCAVSPQQSRPTSPPPGAEPPCPLWTQPLQAMDHWHPLRPSHNEGVVYLRAVLACSAIIILFPQLWECVHHRCSQIFSWEIHSPNPSQGDGHCVKFSFNCICFHTST